MKKFSAVVASFVALLLFPGVAHADAIDDAINTHSNTPGLVTYLHTVRGLGWIATVGDVDSGVSMADLYCHPPAVWLKEQGWTLAQWKPIMAEIMGDPQLVAATDTYCAA